MLHKTLATARHYKNLLGNGDFKNRGKGWNYSGCPINAFEDGITTVCTVQHGGFIQFITDYAAHKGHIMYLKGYIWTTSPSVYFYLNDGTTQVGVNTTVYGSYQFKSVRMTISETAHLIYAKLQDQRASGWDQIYLKNVGLVDLTVEFGAGKEPSQAWCDKYVAPYILNNYLPCTNTVPNGDYHLGSTGWVTTGSPTNLVIADGICSFLATAQYDGYRYPFAHTLGRKYYYCGMVKADSNLVKLDCAGITIQFHSGSGDWEKLSGIWTSTGTTIFPIGARDTRTSGFSTIQQKLIYAYDLTTEYGAGNEPTKEWCDANLDPFKARPRPVYKNVPSNGNFANGATGWTGNRCSLAAANNELTCTITSVVSTIGPYSSVLSVTTGDKIYMSAEIQPIYTNNIVLTIDGGGLSVPIVQTGDWHKAAAVVSVATGTRACFYHYPTGYVIGNKFKLRRLVAINLTKHFGAGNEPSKEWCDREIAPYIEF